jgi:hypothetical protein
MIASRFVFFTTRVAGARVVVLVETGARRITGVERALTGVYPPFE